MKRSHLLGAVWGCLINLLSFSAHAVAVSGQGTWETTLQGRDLDGDLTTAEAYYDTVLGITWLADANYAKTSGYDTFGRLTHDEANLWATSLSINGVTGWRLPDIRPVDGLTYDYNFQYDGSSDVGYNISAPGTVYAGSTGSEMAHMFYNTLGNTGAYDTSGTQTGCIGSGPDYCLTNTGPFSNLISGSPYWLAREYGPNPSVAAWLFVTQAGDQAADAKTFKHYVWVVHDRDVGTAIVPAPAAVWLFGSGLLGLIGIARRKRTA